MTKTIALILLCLTSTAHAQTAERTCAKKQTYECVLTAQTSASNHWRNHRVVQEPYNCGVCNKYHLTTFGTSK